MNARSTVPMSRMHEALHDAWRAFVQQHCLPSLRTPLDVHHDVDAALAWLARESPPSERRDPRAES
jgi:hypothetical protein